eukprot:1088887-Rhodomonas_salina.1
MIESPYETQAISAIAYAHFRYRLRAARGTDRAGVWTPVGQLLLCGRQDGNAQQGRVRLHRLGSYGPRSTARAAVLYWGDAGRTGTQARSTRGCMAY